MDLRRFKIIAIVLLAITVLFLSVNMINGRAELDNLPESVVTDLSRLFLKSGNVLPAELIPLERNRLSVYVCTAANGAAAQSIAQELGESKRKDGNLTDTGYLFRLESEALVTVDHSLYFKFDGSGNGSTSASAVTSAPNAKTRELADKLTKRFTRRYDGREVTLCDYRLVSAAEVGSGAILDFELFIDGLPLHGAGVTVHAKSNGTIVTAEGNGYFFPLEKQSGIARYDVINVIKKEHDSLTAEGIAGLSVTSVEACYIAITEKDAGQICFFPGWRITYSDGTVSVYDAVNCERH